MNKYENAIRSPFRNSKALPDKDLALSGLFDGCLIADSSGGAIDDR